MSYVLLKQVHVSFALASIIGFVLRWNWRMNGSHLSQMMLTKTAPHVIDTLFLTTGVALTFSINQYPLANAWLTAKITGLLVYIVLGLFAMSGKVSKPWRVTAFLAAVSTYAWILTVARFKSPLGLLSFLG
ncbi:MAG: SirB2 family protein [Xanthomonadales bacterium]